MGVIRFRGHVPKGGYEVYSGAGKRIGRGGLRQYERISPISA
jgi:hypothetical protein